MALGRFGHDQLAARGLRQTFGARQTFGHGAHAPVAGVHAQQAASQFGDVDRAVLAHNHLRGALQAGDNLFFVMQVCTAELRQCARRQFQRQHRAIGQLHRVHGRGQAVRHGLAAVVFAAQELHRAGEPARQHIVVFGQGDGEGVLDGVAVHAGHVGQLAAGQVHRAQAKQMRHVQGFAVLGQLQAAGRGHAALGDLPRTAIAGVDLLHTVVDHVGDEDVVLFVQRQVVDAGGQLRDFAALAVGRVDLEQLAGLGVDRPDIALAVVVGGGGHLEFAVDDFDLAIGGVELDDLPLEPQGCQDPAVGANFKSVEAAQVFFDQARGGRAGGIELPQSVAQEHLGGVQLATLLVERNRIHAGQVFGNHADGCAVVVADAHHALQKRGPGHLALGTDGDVIGLALRRIHQDAAFASLLVHLGDGHADHTAAQQAALVVHGQTVHAFEVGWRHHHLRLAVGLRLHRTGEEQGGEGDGFDIEQGRHGRSLQKRFCLTFQYRCQAAAPRPSFTRTHNRRHAHPLHFGF